MGGFILDFKTVLCEVICLGGSSLKFWGGGCLKSNKNKKMSRFSTYVVVLN